MHPQADRRRRALAEFLKSRHLTKGGLARETGITPNVIYNFLGGKSHYLSQPTLEKIAAHYGIAMSMLTGNDEVREPHPTVAMLAEPDRGGMELPAAHRSAGLVPLTVIGIVMGGGVWSETLFSGFESPPGIMLPIPSLYAGCAFAVRLSETAAGSRLPLGAYLGCVAMRDYLQKPQSGDHVLAVQRNRLGLFECSVREYRVEAGRHFLVDDADGHRRGDRVELRSPLDDAAALGYQDMFMHSMVLSYATNLPASSR